MGRTINLKDGSYIEIEADPSTGGVKLTAYDADGNARATMTVGKADGMMIRRSFEEAFAAAGLLTHGQPEETPRREDKRSQNNETQYNARRQQNRQRRPRNRRVHSLATPKTRQTPENRQGQEARQAARR